MSNSVDPDETAHYEQSHLDVCCLQNPVIIARGSERVNQIVHMAGLSLFTPGDETFHVELQSNDFAEKI